MISEEIKDGKWIYTCSECGNRWVYVKEKNGIICTCTESVVIDAPGEPDCDPCDHPLCEFIVIQNAELSTGKRALCKWCGNTVEKRSEDEIAALRIRCNGERTVEITGPSLAVKVFNYAEAYLAHRKAGHPECTQEEVNARLEVCVPCDRYNKLPDPHGSCTVCGCFVNSLTADKGLNKLAWADMYCDHPDGSKWGQIKR